MFRNPRLLLLAFALAAVVVLVALLAFTMGRSPVRPPLPNPNGYDDFIKAGEAVLGDVSDWPVLDHDGLRDLVSTNTEPLRLLRLGLTRQCVMPMDSALTNAAGSMNQLARMTRLVHVLAAEGRLREMENQPADAALSYVEAIRFGNEMSRGGLLITRLVGLVCEATGYTPLAKLAPKLNPDEARAVLSDMDKLDAGRVTWAEVQQSERRYMRYERGKQFNPIIWVMHWWRMRQAMRLAETKHKTMVARQRLLAAELALCCYQSEQGHPPARLDELAPKYLSHVPEDPFSGQPLVYRAQGTNWLLYSVGPDGVDDGGRPLGRGLAGKGDLFFDSPL
ncbi:MAG: hypothetical protein ACLQU3_17605 [Limisphaerales bacterium]